MKFLKSKGLGILLCMGIAGIATILAELQIGGFSLEIIGAPVFSIVFGMLITMLVPKLAGAGQMKEGIKFTSKKILQWAVVILGFSMNLGTIAKVGAQSLPVIIATITTSLVVAFVLQKVLKMDKTVATLIGVGSSICGGSAIAATAPVIDAGDEEVAQSISVIFLFNVLAALIFPYMGQAIGLGSEGFAIFAGTAVNDTSSVTAAASTAENLYQTEGILSAAVTVKLTRTLAIIPITLVLAFLRTRELKKADSAKKGKVGDGVQGKNAINEGSGKESTASEGTVSEGAGFSFKKIFPWFILFFVAAAIITTLVGQFQISQPENAFAAFYFGSFVGYTKWLAKFFIAMAMCAIGLNTNLVTLIKKGGKPILLGLICWISISFVSLGIQLLTGIYYTNIV